MTILIGRWGGGLVTQEHPKILRVCFVTQMQDPQVGRWGGGGTQAPVSPPRSLLLRYYQGLVKPAIPFAFRVSARPSTRGRLARVTRNARRRWLVSRPRLARGDGYIFPSEEHFFIFSSLRCGSWGLARSAPTYWAHNLLKAAVYRYMGRDGRQQIRCCSLA